MDEQHSKDNEKGMDEIQKYKVKQPNNYCKSQYQHQLQTY